MRDLPSGTVTFLFTDIEGSTRLLQELGDAYPHALSEHRRLLRAAFAAHGGVEVDTQGDAFFVAFARAQDALAAATGALTALGSGPIRVRMGIHTGEPIVTDEGYVGIDVHRAARIAAVGHGGQILVSRSTRDLVPTADLRDLGAHRLKDLTGAEQIYQVGRNEFPPLKSLNATNLPVAATPLVGRAREVGELTALLREDARVVTLTGPGGVGKTRLALQVAAELVDEFAGGVFFVRFASVPDADLVSGVIASTVGVREPGDLRERHALLVLDNLEHLLDVAGELADLIAVAPHVKLLVTSRAPLRIAGEQTYPLEPLPADDALRLFSERAREVDPVFVPDDASRAICARLDGLPLALELAAARLRSLDTTTLLERLERSLPLLTTGRRDAPERQRTLRATIEWSYDLLPQALQRAFAQLGVLGSFSLAAAEAVAGADLDTVDALLEASLLKRHGSDRYLMLSTIRELALEHLGNDAEPWRRLLVYLTARATDANLNIEADGPMRHDLVLPERDNIRAALEWALEHGEAAAGLQLALRLENYWVSSVDPREGTRWITALLEQHDPEAADNALALRALGNCATVSGDSEEGLSFYEQSLVAYRKLGDELRTGVALHRVAVNSRDPAHKRALNKEALARFRRVGFKKGEAQSLSVIAFAEYQAGAPERAIPVLEDALALCRETGFSWWETTVLYSLAVALDDLGRPEAAAARIAEALAVARSLEDRTSLVHNLSLLARIAARSDQEVAGLLWGAIEAEMERLPVASWELERAGLGPPLAADPTPAFARGHAAGKSLAFDEGVERGIAWAEV